MNVPGTRINELDANSIETHSSYFNKQQQLRGGGGGGGVQARLQNFTFS